MAPQASILPPSPDTEINGQDLAKYTLTIMYYKRLGQFLQLSSMWLHGLASVAGRVQVASDTRILCSVEAANVLTMRLHIA